ncbi:MAG: Trk system potassium transporter TrkA [Legionellales bacterium]|nr:Trk system potassium transporter TrkA [Legionellales bacterium]|tara:strand:- start:2123 stop:3436 length:1314 start_codon:yes stop_codon:yes gene_type:complete
MKIIILGSTTLSLALADALSREQHDITLIGTDERTLTTAAQYLDIKIMVDMPTYPHILRQADAANADILIAVTDSDEMNMVACQIAYSLFNIPIKIARIRTEHYFTRDELFSDHNLPIDVFIHPDQLIAQAVAQAVESTHMIQHERFNDTECHVCLYRLTSESPLCGQSIESIESNTPMTLAMLRRARRYYPIKPDTLCKPNDELCLIGNASTLDPIRLQHHSHKTSIIISGGNATGLYLAHQLSHQHQIKLIEPELQRCQMLSKELPNVTVLQGDASDDRLLKEEHIEDSDIFCAITTDDEDNILNALQAKHLGAKKTIALIQRDNYLAMLNHRILDIALSPQHIILSSILPHSRSEATHNTIPLRWPHAEVIAIPGQAYLNIRQRTQPKWRICGIIRNTQYYPMQDLSTLTPSDKVICFVSEHSELMALQTHLNL